MGLRLFLLFLFFSSTVFPSSHRTVIKAGKMLDPSSGEISEHRVLLIEDGRISTVGTGEKIPEDAEIIDLSPFTVMPGLIDAHTHICARIRLPSDQLGIEFLDQVLLDPDGYRAIQGAVRARELLQAGFTTIREAGNSGKYADVDVQRAIQEGLISGPTILAAGRIIAPFGGQFRVKADKRFLMNSEYFFADSQEEMTKAVRENIFYGAEVIKIVVDSKRYHYSAEDVAWIVGEAKRAGLKVMAHCQTAEGLTSAVQGGVASIEHGWTIPKDMIVRMKQKGIFLVSTDFPVKILREYGSDEANARRFHQKLIDRLKEVYQGGVKIAFGSDLMIHREKETRGSLALTYIDSFVEAGIPEREIVKIMTSHPAQLLGIEKTRGSLAPGMYGDLIATKENPIENIHTLKEIQFVMKEGVVVKNLRPDPFTTQNR